MAGAAGEAVGDKVTVDFVLRSPDGGEMVLVLVEERRWSELGVVEDLVGRINRCVAYVRQGTFEADFPEATDAKVRVDVQHRHPFDAEAEALFLRLDEALAAQGIELSTQLLGGAVDDDAADDSVDD